MKMSLRHPSGLEIEFEGDEPAFDRFAKFLAGELGGFVRGLNPADTEETPNNELGSGEDGTGTSDDELPSPLGHDGQIDARAVEAHLTRIGATTEIERVTVIAQAALDAGLDGIDYATIPRLYDDMGIPKPPRFPKTFSNAKNRGLVKSIKYGVWATTVQGENYARYGKRPTRRPKRGPAGPTGLERELMPGGGPSGD